MAIVHKRVKKIGTGSESDPFRPDTNANSWSIVEYFGDEFVIEYEEDDLIDENEIARTIE